VADKPAKKAPARVPAPPTDPMQALGKASSIGAPQGAWTPLLTPQEQQSFTGLVQKLLGTSKVVSGPKGRVPEWASANPSVGAAMGMAGITSPLGEVGGAAAAGPIAKFLGWQRGMPEKGIPHMPLYNVEAQGHPLDRSTVTPAALEKHGIPYAPPPPAPSQWSETYHDAQGMQVPGNYFNKYGQETSKPLRSDQDWAPPAKFGGTGKP